MGCYAVKKPSAYALVFIIKNAPCRSGVHGVSTLLSVEGSARTHPTLVVLVLFLVREDSAVKPTHHAVDSNIEITVPARDVNVTTLHDKLRAGFLSATFGLILTPFSSQGDVDTRRIIEVLEDSFKLPSDILFESRRHMDVMSTDSQIHLSSPETYLHGRIPP